MNAGNWAVIVNRVILVNTKWAYWKQLFGTEDSVTLLNHVAPSCFALIQESVLLDVIASVARLLDRTSTSGQQNLVIECLLPDVPVPQRDALTTTLEVIKADAGSWLAIRHKVIAHEDQAVATGLSTLIPSDATLIDDCITRINALLRAMEEAAGAPLHVFGAVSFKGTGKTVLWLLNKAHPLMVKAKSSPPPGTEPDVPDTTQIAMIPVRSPA